MVGVARWQLCLEPVTSAPGSQFRREQECDRDDGPGPLQPLQVEYVSDDHEGRRSTEEQTHDEDLQHWTARSDPRAVKDVARDGVDVSLEFSGAPSAAAEALSALGVGGRLVLVGAVAPKPSIEVLPE